MWFPKTAFALSLFASLFVSANPMDYNPSQLTRARRLGRDGFRHNKKYNGVMCDLITHDSNTLNEIARQACKKLKDDEFYIRQRLFTIPVPLLRRPPKTAISIELYTGEYYTASSPDEKLYLTKIPEGTETQGFIHRVVVGWDKGKNTCTTKGAVKRVSRIFRRCKELEMTDWEMYSKHREVTSMG